MDGTFDECGDFAGQLVWGLKDVAVFFQLTSGPFIWTLVLDGLRSCHRICHRHLLLSWNHARKIGCVVIPCIADNLTDIVHLIPGHLVAHDHVSNNHTGTADRFLSGNHLLVGATDYENVEPQIVVERPVDLVELPYDGLPADFLALCHESDVCKSHLGNRLEQKVLLAQAGYRLVIPGQFKVLLVRLIISASMNTGHIRTQTLPCCGLKASGAMS